MNGFKYDRLNNDLSYHIHHEEGMICEICDYYCANIEIRSIYVYFTVRFRCEKCAKNEYKSFMSTREAIHRNYNNALYLLNAVNGYKIPRKYLKEIFKYNNGKDLPSDTEHLAFVTFNTKICKRARLAIHTFCLFCIKYHKAKLNKDVRRKISQMIWDNKIEFLK